VAEGVSRRKRRDVAAAAWRGISDGGSGHEQQHGIQCVTLFCGHNLALSRASRTRMFCWYGLRGRTAAWASAAVSRHRVGGAALAPRRRIAPRAASCRRTPASFAWCSRHAPSVAPGHGALSDYREKLTSQGERSIKKRAARDGDVAVAYPYGHNVSNLACAARMRISSTLLSPATARFLEGWHQKISAISKTSISGRATKA